MTTRWEPTVHLLATGSIVPNLHYGPFLYDWWYVKFTKENGVTKQTFYPFQVGYKCKTEIKELQITTQIVQENMLNSQVPRFCCEENEISGLQIMGFDNQTILSKLISDISFKPFNFSINKLSIVIHSIGVFLNKDWGYAENDNIIELHQSLGEIYSKNYEISNRELRAWHVMLNATGYTNITLFNRQESK
ncbi:10377_t:CDS:2, partial [Cetraspora pellucida]